MMDFGDGPERGREKEAAPLVEPDWWLAVDVGDLPQPGERERNATKKSRVCKKCIKRKT